ncbi:hypothetical protein HK097_001619 [Rhizophlyctis rosea]|uniref:Uncharacterized protein n=1 Tax=Rhizophlyctis rosea TaxID=64517 RepID=A0AAD5S6G0_9FUNG|nr:hypothetical protein HK097_001619 [Rhizophlyctis rosea]
MSPAYTEHSRLIYDSPKHGHINCIETAIAFQMEHFNVTYAELAARALKGSIRGNKPSAADHIITQCYAERNDISFYDCMWNVIQMEEPELTRVFLYHGVPVSPYHLKYVVDRENIELVRVMSEYE